MFNIIDFCKEFPNIFDHLPSRNKIVIKTIDGDN